MCLSLCALGSVCVPNDKCQLNTGNTIFLFYTQIHDPTFMIPYYPRASHNRCPCEEADFWLLKRTLRSLFRVIFAFPVLPRVYCTTYLFSVSASVPLKHDAERRQKGGINRMGNTNEGWKAEGNTDGQREGWTEIGQTDRRIVYHRIGPAGAPAEASRLWFSEHTWTSSWSLWRQTDRQVVRQTAQKTDEHNNKLGREKP